MLFVLPVFVPNTVHGELISVTSRESTIQEKIQAEFESTPKMFNIVKCESEFRQFDSKGKPLMSPTSDVGVMQVNQIHWKRAKSLGFDIFYSIDDNIAYAKIILREQGIDAWEALKSTCYKNLVLNKTLKGSLLANKF